jgi:hypothetical protein
MTNQRFLSAVSNFRRFSVCAFLALGAVCLPAYAQDAAPAADQAKTPKKQIHVLRPRSGSAEWNRLRQPLERRTIEQSELTPVNTGSGIVYTCDANFASSAPAGTCEYLNTVIASYYNSTFTNANASIYLVFGSTGLGETNSYLNYLTYDQYLSGYNSITGKSAIQTSALSALGTYDATPYGSGQVGVTVALGSTLGYPASGFTGTTASGDFCTAGTEGCYDAVTTITNDPGTPLYYDNVGGAEPSDAYDFYSTVMHETDEVLGTSSCISTGNTPLADGCDGYGPDSSQVGTPSAVDLFRYSSAGHLVLDSSLSTTAGAYFSYNGGTTNGANGMGGTPKVYNTLDNGDDYADFVSSSPDCGTNEAVQDAEGCPGEDAGLNILNDGGAEINILNAVGFSVPAANPAPVLTSPTPSSTLSGASVTFTWTSVSGSAGYWLFLGTTGVGSKNLYDSNQQAATSATFNNLPTDGVTIYARVYTKNNGTLYYNDYTYTAAVKAPVLTSPAPGGTLTGTTATFTWTASGGQGYWLFVGTTGVGSKNIIDTGEQTATSATVSGLPSNGTKLYVRVYSRVNGTLYYNDYTYTSYMEPPVLTSPTPGSTLGGASETFTWSAASSGNQGYWLFLGTTGVGSKNLYDSGQQTATSTTFSGLPTNGVTIYARVYTRYNGVLVYNDYTYKAE